jgi:hypothetical protein
MPPLEEVIKDRDFLASISDLIGTMHKIDAKVSKLHDVVIGNEEYGQEGIIFKLKAIENDLEKIKVVDTLLLRQEVDNLKGYKNKLIGFFVAGGVLAGIAWEMIKSVFKH